jgi:hypothetical protein
MRCNRQKLLSKISLHRYSIARRSAQLTLNKDEFAKAKTTSSHKIQSAHMRKVLQKGLIFHKAPIAMLYQKRH